VIASMALAVMQAHSVDPKRIYIAGLSAGGAMAAITGALYPEVFAAVGVHSGLAPGAASSLPEALAAMSGAAAAPAPLAGVARPGTLTLPVIVFHGDQDQTVHPRNGKQVIAAAQGANPTSPASAAATAASGNGQRVHTGVSPQGRRYTRTVFDVPAGEGAAEHWLLHGAGHAWSGGQAAGTFTDPLGPDASREMLRFFLQHPLRPTP
jgi:poly(3-hydroxybutyrate) depolymerase